MDLGGESLPFNDGQVREGKNLYVVQNRLNVLTKLELSTDGAKARVIERRNDPRFDVHRVGQPVLPGQRPIHHPADPGDQLQRGRHYQVLTNQASSLPR
jgi:hypothetical protein